MRVHWGTSGNDSTAFTGAMQVDSVVVYGEDGRKVPVVNNRWYKALAYFHDQFFIEVQLADVASESNNKASAQAQDPPPITDEFSSSTVRLSEFVFQAKTANTGNFDAVTFEDDRQVHGIGASVGVSEHSKLSGNSDDDQHPINAIIGGDDSLAVQTALNIGTATVHNDFIDSIATALKLEAVRDSIQAVITAESVPNDSIAAIIPLNNNISDYSVFGNNGTATDITFTDTTIIGGAASFNGTSSFANINDVRTLIAPAQVGAIELWIKPSSLPVGGDYVLIAFSESGASGEQIKLRLDSDAQTVSFLFRTGSSTLWTVTTDIDVIFIGVWVHLMLTQDATSPVLYVNGIAVAQTISPSIDITAWMGDSATNMGTIGKLVTTVSSGFYHGIMDEIYIWNRAPSAGEVLSLFEQSKVRHLNNTKLDTGGFVWIDDDTMKVGRDSVFTNLSLPHSVGIEGDLQAMGDIYARTVLLTGADAAERFTWSGAVKSKFIDIPVTDEINISISDPFVKRNTIKVKTNSQSYKGKKKVHNRPIVRGQRIKLIPNRTVLSIDTSQIIIEGDITQVITPIYAEETITVEYDRLVAQPGDVVVFRGDGVQYADSYGGIGWIISSNPGMVHNANLLHSVPLVEFGTAPCKVSAEMGSIQRYDELMVGMDGFAVKWETGNHILGLAREAVLSGTAMIEVKIVR